MKLTRIYAEKETVVIKPVYLTALRRINFNLYEYRFRTSKNCEYVLHLSGLDLEDMGLKYISPLTTADQT